MASCCILDRLAHRRSGRILTPTSDALASDVTILTAQIAEIEARLSEEKNRRERDRVLGEIEAIKKRIKQTASTFAPVIGELCEAIEMAAAVVPEARELNSFLLSLATEVDTVIDPLLRELDRRADAVRVDAALDLPCLAMRRRPSYQKILMIAYFVFHYGCLATSAMLG